jgi:hypothetical protein
MNGERVFSTISKASDEARFQISKLGYDERVYREIVRKLDHYLFSHALINFNHNLTEEHVLELGIGPDEVKDIREKFKVLFDASESSEEGVSEEQYKQFKRHIKSIHGAYLLLREVEKKMKFKECKEIIRSFQNDYKVLGSNIIKR